MKTRYYIAAPAYGRDYHTAKAALADWRAGLDFRNMTTGVRGAYLNIADIPAGCTVQIRYRGLSELVVVAS